jgi:hypothetical protein
MATVAHAVLVGAATLTPPTVGAAAVVAPAARVNAFGDVAPPYLGEPVGPGWVVRTRWVTGNVAKTTVVGGAVARAKFVADRSRGSFLG